MSELSENLVENVKISRIRLEPEKYRHFALDIDGIERLTEDIREKGLLVPVLLWRRQGENILIGTLFMVIMSTLVNIPSISVWAYGGSVIRNYLNNEKLKKIVEWILAIMLIATAASVFLYNT